MKFGFDVDEVIANLVGEFEKYLRDRYGLDWPPECFHQYKFRDCRFVDDEEMNKKIIDEMNIISNDPDFQMAAMPFPDAASTIRRLKKQGHSIHFITNRPKINKEKTIAWFNLHKISFDSIHVIGQEEKGMVGRALNLDFFIDDLEKHLESMYRYKNRWRKGLGLMNKPWNRLSIDGSRFIRFNDWVEISRHLGINNR